MKKRLDKSLVGACGVFFVSAELSLRDWIAMPTIRNTAGVDIIATKNGRTVTVQVKTNSYGQVKYPMKESGELVADELMYYVFVTLKSKPERPDFYIVPSKFVADYIKKTHKYWTTLAPRQKRAVYIGSTEKEIVEKREKSTLRQFPNYIGKLLPEFENFKIEDYKDQWGELDKC